MNPTIRAYIDLTRLQFFFAWPLLFCSGYLLATTVYGNFAWFDLARVCLIGFFGFEAGLVLNDYIDRDYDKKDIESDKLTKYWRIYRTRPIPAGLISPNHALGLFIGLAAIATALIVTLPYPHSLIVLLIMLYSYTIEMFYQIEKRQRQQFPFAQLIGRTDFALFPVAGYLCLGNPDLNAFLYFVFFYPFALAHLGVNDLIDVANDRVRGMSTIPILYDIPRTTCWSGIYDYPCDDGVPFHDQAWMDRPGWSFDRADNPHGCKRSDPEEQDTGNRSESASAFPCNHARLCRIDWAGFGNLTGGN